MPAITEDYQRIKLLEQQSRGLANRVETLEEKIDVLARIIKNDLDERIKRHEKLKSLNEKL